MKRRTSYYLERLKNELRHHALKEDDEETAKNYWRMYYRAINAEQEVRELVLEAEVRRLLDFLVREGMADGLIDEINQSHDEASSNMQRLDDDDIPPTQKCLWD